MRKMRWDCSPEKDGCFNQKKRVKLGVFDECFPGNIGLGDVDGIVEINGFCLMIEWKGEGVPVPTGQRIMFERITKTPMFTVIAIEGDVEKMSVSRYRLWFNAEAKDWVEADLKKVKKVMSRWAAWTRKRH